MVIWLNDEEKQAAWREKYNLGPAPKKAEPQT